MGEVRRGEEALVPDRKPEVLTGLKAIGAVGPPLGPNFIPDEDQLPWLNSKEVVRATLPVVGAAIGEITPFMDGVRTALLEKGVPETRIHYEIFGPDTWSPVAA